MVDISNLSEEEVREMVKESMEDTPGRDIMHDKQGYRDSDSEYFSQGVDSPDVKYAPEDTVKSEGGRMFTLPAAPSRSEVEIRLELALKAIDYLGVGQVDIDKLDEVANWVVNKTVPTAPVKG